MSALPIGLAIEVLVAILLVITIGYCVMLNARLKRFRSDEQSLKATIAELVTATELAERAIRTLKSTVAEADAALGRRLAEGEAAMRDLDRLVESADRARARTAAAPSPAAEPQARSEAPRPAARFGARPAFAALRG